MAEHFSAVPVGGSCRLGVDERRFYRLSVGQGLVLGLVANGMLALSALTSAGAVPTVGRLSPGTAGLLIGSALSTGEFLASCPQAMLQVHKCFQIIGYILAPQARQQDQREDIRET
eukprot:1194739-Prorocentrum_minimum.AAC.3